MNRTGLWVVLVLVMLTAGWGRSAQADTHLTADQMRVALRTATVQEDGFIDRVLAAVEKGILPEDLVNSTFFWARKRPKHNFMYFKFGLMLRAADLGITIQ
jgi:hypothetical protein